MTPSQTFTWTVPTGDGMSHIPVPFDQRAEFSQARPPVAVTVNGYRYRSTIAIMAGETFVPLRRSHRDAAGIEGGETVEVTLALDTAPRTVDPPDDLAEAIGAAGLCAAWDKLSFTSQREHAEAVGTAKKPETRDRRIAAILAGLAFKA